MNKVRNQREVLRNWLEVVRKEDSATILWSAGYPDTYGIFEGLLAIGQQQVDNDWESLNVGDNRLRIVSLSYDAKNEIEPSLGSNNPDVFHRPSIELIMPNHWEMLLRNGEIVDTEKDLTTVTSLSLGANHSSDHSVNLVEHWDGTVRLTMNLADETDTQYREVEKVNSLHNQASTIAGSEEHIQWKAKVSKSQYYETIAWIKSKIISGDFYEMNYCVSFEASAEIDPYWVFEVMTQVSAAPMMTFMKRGNYYLMSSSMERYLRSDGTWLLSQPIKGTMRNTSGNNAERLQSLADALYQSEKDKAENVMIVDLVRNDLSRICLPDSVKVRELCGIYAFPHVLQMISTVIGRKKSGIRFSDVIKATFPMGSMTGAPKIAVLEACEQVENFKRGLYSGSIGWICGDCFDLNVVIRTLQFDQSLHYLQYAVGGAITMDSIADEEYQECLAKAEAVLKTLSAAGYSISNL